MGFITGFFRFWYDFIVGDAWEIAAGIVVVLVICAVLGATNALGDAAEYTLTLLAGAGIVVVVTASLFAEARRRSRAS
jgi:hypothetical protein